MMTDQFLSPIPFLYQGEHLVRAIVGPDGDPWFVAPDVARFLGYRDAEKALRIVANDEKGTLQMGTLGGKQTVSIVSESGFYTLAFRSNKPNAVEFRRWVTHEVLPSIRRTGGYQTADKNWTDKLTAVRLSVAELRRSYGPRKAALLGADLWRKVDIIVNDPLPPQRELDLGDDESNVVDMRPDEAG